MSFNQSVSLDSYDKFSFILYCCIKPVTDSSLKMAGNIDTAAHMRFLATVRRQSAPPRCNPFVIVLQVNNCNNICIHMIH